MLPNHFPPGVTRSKYRRSRWKEVEFMHREICAVILPRPNLKQTLRDWHEIAKGLAESKRKRVRFRFC